MWLIRKILFPFSLIYGMIVYVRNRFYDWGIFSAKSYSVPIICIGNLSVGGTGKTPMVELFIELLQRDYKVAVLSRGYKRKSKGYFLADAASSPEQLGDEPFQIHSKFTDISVAVDANRQNGVVKLQEAVQPDVIILDDAFQHRKITPGFSVLLTAFDSIYTRDWYLPTGNLRDSKREARRADVLVVTKCPIDSSEAERLNIRRTLAPEEGQITVFSYLAYDSQLGGTGTLKTIADLEHKEVTLVTGIANPKPLLNFLTSLGVSFEHYSFNDHHFFSKDEIERLASKTNILTTEKDFVRLKDALNNINYIAVKHEFFGDGLESLQSGLKEFMSQYF
jgi:tetraacyldisaccharide 4'-kinase